MSDIAGTLVPATTDWEDLLYRMGELTSDEARLRYLSLELIRLHRGLPSFPDPFVAEILRRLFLRPGEPCGVLLMDLNLSVRQAERRFKKAVGVPVKPYADTIRMGSVLRTIRNRPELSLMEIAFRYGFTDHSHLTRFIKTMTGRPPSCFRTGR